MEELSLKLGPPTLRASEAHTSAPGPWSARGGGGPLRMSRWSNGRPCRLLRAPTAFVAEPVSKTPAGGPTGSIQAFGAPASHVRFEMLPDTLFHASPGHLMHAAPDSDVQNAGSNLLTKVNLIDFKQAMRASWLEGQDRGTTLDTLNKGPPGPCPRHRTPSTRTPTRIKKMPYATWMSVHGSNATLMVLTDKTRSRGTNGAHAGSVSRNFGSIDSGTTPAIYPYDQKT